jgi:mannose-6-phosphate isomerase-like protein (cupin superfamily)
MRTAIRSLTVAGLVVGLALLAGVPAGRADVDPKIVAVTTPAEIKWVEAPGGTSATAVMFGDPTKPGPYSLRIKWHPGHMSRPHTHGTDRYFVVISGTWWVGSGTKYDPDSTVPVKPGSFVVHYANQPHYDGAKDEEAVIQVWGIGPLTTVSAEQKP